MGQRRTLRQLNKLLRKVRECGDEMRRRSDEELAHATAEFRERLAEGEEPDGLLPEAFAAVCEADRRILGMEPFDVQVLGGIALHQGYLAEMNTGEGKTLVATMPLYLNALTGKSTILVTANEYLALRDAEEMGRVFRFMGLSVAAGVRAKAEERISNEEKKRIYAADIVYTTHSVLGFDYLLNNLVTRAQDRFMREFYYVIIDEADSVLLDAAQMPLVISGAPRVQSNLYQTADFFVTTLVNDTDYKKEDKKVWLTDAGVEYAERFFQIDNFYGKKQFEINRHVTLALRAHALFEEGREYMVSSKNEIVLLDERSGRAAPGVKLRGGQHQAIEVKEGIEPSQENRSVASITYQNLFLLFPKMAGMSGTLYDASEELLNVYGKKVLVIPPNCPVQRKDLPDLYFKDRESQFQTAVYAALEAHRTGRPVLIVVTTIGETEQVSKMLMKERIAHNVLNANNAFWEADIIREAGQKYAVTVATSMAGRGTDIRLGEGVKKLGGLAVIGIGRMVNVRQERQARGRAGRQGDPGTSRFFVSIEDEVVRSNGPADVDKYIEGRRRIGKRKVKKLVCNAQSLGEEFAVLSRKRAVDYDQVMQWQRKLMYQTRDDLLDGRALHSSQILDMAARNIDYFLDGQKELDQSAVKRYLLDHISYRLDDGLTGISAKKREDVRKYLMSRVKQGLKEQEERLGSSRPLMKEFMRTAVLNAIDHAWVEQVDYLQQLQAAVAGRASAQRNLVFEYHGDALAAFRDMERTIRKDAMRNILLSSVYIDEENKLHILFP
ncbi:MAG: accessory Sec system translocase SecA2 [Roseburia sp.]|jgi:preprotein translocase subunit SecA|nr:accessory Sec system translocase SecA2 [Roseburia sp.]